MREHGAYPSPERTVPEYRWPSEAHLCPKSCWHCATNLLYGDVPRARDDTTDVVCWCCSRLQYTLTSDLTPRRLTPDEWRALPANQSQRGRPGRPPSVTGTIAARIVRLLEDGRTMTTEMLSEALHISVVQARNGAYDARKQGHAIRFSDGAYRMEATP